MAQLPVLSQTHCHPPFSQHPDLLLYLPLWELRFSGCPLHFPLQVCPSLFSTDLLIALQVLPRKGSGPRVGRMKKGVRRKVGWPVDLFSSLLVSFLFVGFPGHLVPQFPELPLSALPRSSGLSFFLPYPLSPSPLPFCFLTLASLLAGTDPHSGCCIKNSELRAEDRAGTWLTVAVCVCGRVGWGRFSPRVNQSFRSPRGRLTVPVPPKPLQSMAHSSRPLLSSPGAAVTPGSAGLV